MSQYTIFPSFAASNSLVAYLKRDGPEAQRERSRILDVARTIALADTRAARLGTSLRVLLERL